MYATQLGLATEWMLHVDNKEDSVLITVSSYVDEVAAVGVIIGLLFVAFSREQLEDEMINQLRLEALQWSVFVNYTILLITVLLVYDTEFFNVIVYNMFTILLVFIGRFRWSIYQLNRSGTV